ncbi:unnamed protein product [Allacma fusca]|uniref:Uncharacterized protein n=1 Tax=Allacma fusca TaxID=39272 RepID=A0A8J2NWU6_9HEXA|nr:unnamed protein product [Allacma fusca]
MTYMYFCIMQSWYEIPVNRTIKLPLRNMIHNFILTGDIAISRCEGRHGGFTFSSFGSNDFLMKPKTGETLIMEVTVGT